MKNMRLRAAAMTAAITLSLAAGATGVFAGTLDDPAAAEQTSPGSGAKITKSVEYADGITTAEAKAFTFTFTQTGGPKSTADSAYSSTAGDYVTADIADAEVTLDKLANQSAGAGKSTVVTAEGGEIDLSALTAAGKYSYTVAESGTSDDGYGWKYDSSTYALQVFVQADGSKEYTIFNNKTNEKISDIRDFAFSNVYTEKGGNNVPDGNDADNDGTPDSLVITKAVSGSHANKNQEFTFTVNFTKSATDKSTDTTYTATKVSADGQTKTDVTVNQTDGTFTLKDGESLVFDDIPAGTYYTVKESGADNYTGKAEVVANGAAQTAVTASVRGADVATEQSLIGENKNSAVFTNAYTPITVTGVFTNYSSFIRIIALAAVFAVSAALFAAARRKSTR